VLRQIVPSTGSSNRIADGGHAAVYDGVAVALIRLRERRMALYIVFD